MPSRGYHEGVPRTITTDKLRKLVSDGDAQLVEVLPRPAYETEHLPGAVSIPLGEMTDRTVSSLDRTKPVVAYCYDYQCDLSARAAARLESLGFEDVYDYTASKLAWFAEGLPAEGTTPPSSRAGALAREVPTCDIEETVADLGPRFDARDMVVVIDGQNVVLGVVRREVLALPGETPVEVAMQLAPATVRPSITASELAKSMVKDDRESVLVTALDGRLIGVIGRDDLHGDH
jgi:rhodanese-related sulfurtransferase